MQPGLRLSSDNGSLQRTLKSHSRFTSVDAARSHPNLTNLFASLSSLEEETLPLRSLLVERLGDQSYDSLPLMPILSPLYLCWRKVLDYAFGLCGLFLLLLLMPVLALLIYLDSPGPLFYCQERVGYQGRIFFIYKFRSMRVDAELSGCALWATENDLRVTRIGRFLRTTHLDELPQALNILRGEMSLIGPRPERPEFVAQLETAIPFYRCRLSVKPGLTGWAQVKYTYTRTPQESLLKVQHDLYYLQHQSVSFDLLIILKTGVEMLLCRGR